jgi:uncharacterized protein (TIGR02145 family)
VQLKDVKRFLALNSDAIPADLKPEEITHALNMRMASSNEKQGAGDAETLQGEVEIPINATADITYYGQAIGGNFLYQGWDEIKIGTQVWMRRNWDVAYPGSKVYNDNEANRAIYGGLYTWNQIMSVDFAPDGWHVPTDAEITVLLTYMGGLMLAGGHMKEVGEEHWTDPNTGADDSFGFRALPGGKFDSVFELLGANGLFWLQDESIFAVSIVTTKNGSYSMDIAGDGPINITWGDGSADTPYTLTGTPHTFTHAYTGVAKTITISNPENITKFFALNDNITSITGLNLCDGLINTNLNNNLISSLVLGSWPSLESFNVGSNLLTSFIGLPSWVNLTDLTIDDNPITTVLFCAEWVNLVALYSYGGLFASVTLHKEWVNLTNLEIADNPNVASVGTFKEWVNLYSINVSYTNITHLDTFVEWINLARLYTRDCPNMGNVTVFPAWVHMETLYLASCPNITSLVNYATWTVLVFLTVNGCSITVANVINQILIVLDSSGITTGNIDLAGGTNAAPAGLGITAKNNLIAKGVTVTTN